MSRLTRPGVLGLCLLSLASSPGRAQGPAPAPAQAPAPLRVFLDCQTLGCDFDYFRTSIPWLDWMRERRDADVHVLVTEEATGGGGTRYTLTFLGRGSLAGRQDTLALVLPAAATDDEKRKGLAQRIRVGVVEFAARTPLLDRLTVGAESPAGGAFGDYGRIRNQVNLPASGASDEDILLRLRQLETSYRYYTYIGLRYTFGSIHNNIVNPRFSSVSGGGSTMIISF